MAREEFRNILLAVRPDRPWIICFVPLSLRIGRAVRMACYALLALLPGPAGLLPSPESNPTTLIYSTQLGEHKRVTLSDGSDVDLNSASSISVTFSALARSIELTKGEALFRVTHQSTRPFRVKSGRSLIEDVGTAFDVYKKRHSVLVLVVDGRIKIYRKAPTASHVGPNADRANSATAGGNTLPPEFHRGQQIELPEDSNGSLQVLSNVSNAGLSRLTAWREGRLEYQGEPLAQAVEDFGRYHTERFVLGDKALRKLRVGGSISTDSVDQFLLMLGLEFNIQAARSIDADGSTIITLTSGRPKKAADDH
ncbi:MAG: FecR family protein [Steroidobacteraceae bacterium]